ncbi:MAG: dolichyl-phosphate beta-glucosyltransferase [Myxococcaceae bacterium]
MSSATHTSRATHPEGTSLRELSIVIPAFNEEKRLPATLEEIEKWARENLDRAEILIVDDGSSDGTLELARHFAARCTGKISARALSNGTNRGKGASVRAGVLAATLPWILMTDADLSTPIEDVLKLAAERANADVLIGSRAIAGANITKHQPLHRELMGKTFNKLVRVFVTGGLSDTQCGFKLFGREAGQAIFSRTRIDRFAFDVEAIYLARKLGYRVTEVPVHWENSPASTVDPLRDSSRMFVDILRIRWMHRND